MQTVLLAGGQATRMLPLTASTPKSMLDVAGRPFVDWQLEKLAACGFDDVVLCIGHLGDQIRAHVQDGARFRLRVRYSDEGDDRHGTAGALRLALDLLAPTFLVTYGDSYLPFDYSAPMSLLAEHDDCDGVMTVCANAGSVRDVSNVVTDGEWILRYEKGATDLAFDHIDYGAIALRRRVIAEMPAGTHAGFDEIQRALAERKRLRAFVARDRFFEIGSREGLLTLARHLRDRPRDP